MGNPANSTFGQNASGNFIAQASGNSSASVTQNNYNFNVSIKIGDGIEDLNHLGSLLPNDFIESIIASGAASSPVLHSIEQVTSHPVINLWERGQLLYELNLNGSKEEIVTALDEWQFASSSQRQPHAAIANGIIGMGQDDGVTFNLAPIEPIDNCSVECDLQIINFGNNQSNWGGIRVRGFNFCPDFRLGYLVYLRQVKTVDLYGPYGVIDGDKQVMLDPTDPWTHLRVDVCDSQIEVYINGDRRISVADRNLGNKGLIYLHTFRTHTQFRNFRVYEMIRVNNQ